MFMDDDNYKPNARFASTTNKKFIDLVNKKCRMDIVEEQWPLDGRYVRAIFNDPFHFITTSYINKIETDGKLIIIHTRNSTYIFERF